MKNHHNYCDGLYIINNYALCNYFNNNNFTRDGNEKLFVLPIP